MKLGQEAYFSSVVTYHCFTCNHLQLVAGLVVSFHSVWMVAKMSLITVLTAEATLVPTAGCNYHEQGLPGIDYFSLIALSDFSIKYSLS